MTAARTIDDAAVSLASQLGERGLTCILESDAFLGQDSGRILLCFWVDGKWHTEYVDGPTDDPFDTLQVVMCEAVRAQERTRRAHLRVIDGGRRGESTRGAPIVDR